MGALSIRNYLPRSLYGRVALILLVPIVTIQIVVSSSFIQRLYEGVTRQMTQNVVTEIRYIINKVKSFDPNLNSEADIFLLIQNLNMQAIWADQAVLPRRQFYDLSGKVVVDVLFENLESVVSVDLIDDKRSVVLSYQLPDRFLEIRFPRYRVSASNPHQLLVLMAFTGVLMTAIAYLFLKNQVRPIKRLARAAEAFGKGRYIHYSPSGADEVRAAGKAFLEMRSRIEQQIEQRALIYSGVSHDLRTPLTRLKLGLSMQEESEDNNDLIQDVNEIERLIDEFLDFSKDGYIDDPILVDPMTIIRDIIDNSNRVNLKVVLSKGLTSDKKIMLRPLSIKRALENLISNAGKWSKSVSCSVNLSNSILVFVVEDDGPGIPSDKRKEAVKAFTKLDRSRNQDRGGGVGLGLAISADIAKSHGGELRLGTSELLGGLKVEILIPI